MQFRIKQCREEAGLSQEALSERAGVSRTIISGLESGKITVTTTDTLLKIAKALNKNVRLQMLDPSGRHILLLAVLLRHFI